MRSLDDLMGITNTANIKEVECLMEILIEKPGENDMAFTSEVWASSGQQNIYSIYRDKATKKIILCILAQPTTMGLLDPILLRMDGDLIEKLLQSVGAKHIKLDEDAPSGVN